MANIWLTPEQDQQLQEAQKGLLMARICSINQVKIYEKEE